MQTVTVDSNIYVYAILWDGKPLQLLESAMPVKLG